MVLGTAALLAQDDTVLGLPWWLWLLILVVIVALLLARRRPRGEQTDVDRGGPNVPGATPAPDQFGPTPIPAPPSDSHTVPPEVAREAGGPRISERCQEDDERWEGQDEPHTFAILDPDDHLAMTLTVTYGDQRAEQALPGSDESGRMSQEALLGFDDARLIEIARALPQHFAATDEAAAPSIAVVLRLTGEVVEATCLRLLRCREGRWEDTGQRECRRVTRPDPIDESVDLTESGASATSEPEVLQGLRRAVAAAQSLVMARRRAAEQLEAYCESCRGEAP